MSNQVQLNYGTNKKTPNYFKNAGKSLLERTGIVSSLAGETPAYFANAGKSKLEATTGVNMKEANNARGVLGTLYNTVSGAFGASTGGRRRRRRTNRNKRRTNRNKRRTNRK